MLRRNLSAFPVPSRRGISDILCAVRNFVLCPALVLVAAACCLISVVRPARSLAQQSEPQPAPQQEPAPAAPTPPPPSGPVIVLDPAHGGTDTGARGENGVAEKDIVLQIARAVREQLAKQSYRVLMTRNDDSNPSYDERAAIADAYHDAIFVSLHVSSTGTPGSVHTYFDQIGAPVPVPPPAAAPGTKAITPPTNGLTAWEDAQRPYIDVSHRLADLIQADLAQSFSGSPAASVAAPVRALRAVTGPAVAVELSSVSGSTPDSLNAAEGPLSAAIGHGIAELRQAVSTGGR